MHKSVITAALLAALALPAQSAELRVMAGGSLAASFADLGPRFEKASGHKLTITFAATPQLIKQASSGETLDIAVVPREVFKDAQAAARLPAPAQIGRVGYGVAVRAGAPKPDLSTPEAFKATLLKAQSIVFLPESAAGAYIIKVFDQLGIAAEMKAKTRAVTATPQIAQTVANGDAELGLFLLNVLAVPGLDVAGPFPAPLQSELVYDGAVAADSKEAAAAKAFIDYLKTPEAMAVFKTKGITPG
jgi:molybdate transport system substrate-binding protein